MIQRIQSLWLLLAAVTLLCLIFVPALSKTIGPETYEMMGKGIYKTTAGITTEVKSFLPLMIMIVATALVCIVNLFNFKNRTAQKRGIIIAIVLIISVSFWNSRYAQQLPGGMDDADVGPGMFLPMIAIAFCVLAIRGIRKDEKLIRSADRLR